ncbi:MAG: flagellar biosynthesis anti-sigma factor FlgM [Lysinibacillus sp.]
MKIFNYGVQGVNPYTNAKRKDPVQKADQSFADKLEISSAAKELNVTNEFSAQRAEKVQQLKADIQSGAYKVDANKVAADMLKYYKF